MDKEEEKHPGYPIKYGSPRGMVASAYAMALKEVFNAIMKAIKARRKKNKDKKKRDTK